MRVQRVGNGDKLMILYNCVCGAFEYALLVGGRGGTSRPGKRVRSTFVAL
jgi:hypothetical protein